MFVTENLGHSASKGSSTLSSPISPFLGVLPPPHTLVTKITSFIRNTSQRAGERIPEEVVHFGKTDVVVLWTSGRASPLDTDTVAVVAWLL
jgi:hypothetical protein